MEVYCLFESNWEYLELIKIYKDESKANKAMLKLEGTQIGRKFPDSYFIRSHEVIE